MTDNKTDRTFSWKNWIIKKLLSSESTKEEILNFIASESEEKKHLTDLDDNNEKNLIIFMGAGSITHEAHKIVKENHEFRKF